MREERLNNSLNLRKNKLFQDLMRKRHKKFSENSKNFQYRIKDLNLNPYQDELYNYNNLTEEFQLEIIYKILNKYIDNYNPLDYNDLFYQNEIKEIQIPDIIKFSLQKLYEILVHLDEVNCSTEGEQIFIELDENIFIKLISVLDRVKEYQIIGLILEILYLFSLSDEILDYLYKNKGYFKIFLKLMSLENNEIVRSIIIIIKFQKFIFYIKKLKNFFL